MLVSLDDQVMVLFVAVFGVTAAVNCNVDFACKEVTLPSLVTPMVCTGIAATSMACCPKTVLSSLETSLSVQVPAVPKALVCVYDGGFHRFPGAPGTGCHEWIFDGVGSCGTYGEAAHFA